MTAVGVFPSLSELLAWPTEHLTDAAEHCEAIGGRSYGVASQVRRDSLSVDWQGHAADTLRSATHTDLKTTSVAVDQLQDAAQVARSGASDLYAARARVHHAVEDASEASFDVREDLSVTDRFTGGSLGWRAGRQAEAQSFSADIRQRAGQLLDVDQQIATKIARATAGIRNAFAQGPTTGTPPYDNRIRAVDNHTWKQDPVPAQGSANGPSAGDIRRVLDQLPAGDKPFIREIRSPEDLQRLWDWARLNGAEIPNAYGDPDKGLRYQLPDGATIGQRWSADSTGKPVLDFDVPGKGGYTKIHINPRGGIPDIPAPTSRGLPEC